MSGYCARRGVYELTYTRCCYLLRHRHLAGPARFWDKVEVLLESKGLRVVARAKSFITVKATEAQVWTALTGLPPCGGHDR